ncbi:MAG: YbjN domain-containing protein [Spirochaetes bacterium]|nr:YbjN domain-containing protein [Spirochaetota bacterium]MBU0955382.1 YbjN domain-containing protein [Spirochaetota bacterium]
MAGLSKVESYLMDLNVEYQEISEKTYFINDAERGLPGIVVSIDEPIVIISAKVMPMPAKVDPELYRELLVLNASAITHGAYAIEGDDVILLDSLEYETMDKGEFEASIDSIGMALAEHYSILGKYRNQ